MDLLNWVPIASLIVQIYCIFLFLKRYPRSLYGHFWYFSQIMFVGQLVLTAVWYANHFYEIYYYERTVGFLTGFYIFTICSLILLGLAFPVTLKRVKTIWRIPFLGLGIGGLLNTETVFVLGIVLLVVLNYAWYRLADKRDQALVKSLRFLFIYFVCAISYLYDFYFQIFFLLNICFLFDLINLISLRAKFSLASEQE